MQKINLIVDCDPGIDDAIAIMMGFMSNDKLNIQLLSVLAGNLGIERSTANALILKELFNKKDIPVVSGAAKPLKKILETAGNVHGKFGLGSYKCEKPKTAPLNVNLQNFTMQLLENNGLKNTTILVLGPMTNLASLMLSKPECKKFIKEIVFMGGSTEPVYKTEDGKDYVIPYAEFNINVDPEAAEIVLKSGIPLVMVPMEMGHTAFLNKKDIKKTKQLNKMGKIFEKFYKGYLDGHVPKGNAATHDACAMAYLIEPDIFTTALAKLSVCKDKRGSATINCDFNNLKSKSNLSTVCIEIDSEKFKKLYFSLLGKAK